MKIEIGNLYQYNGRVVRVLDMSQSDVEFSYWHGSDWEPQMKDRSEFEAGVKYHLDEEKDNLIDFECTSPYFMEDIPDTPDAPSEEQ